ncbi:MAG: sulfotransferase family protein [Spirochaetaceae bacterium]
MSRRRTSLPESGRIPPAIRAVNAALGLVDGTIAGTLTVDRLLDDARNRTGLEDFGPGDIETPLSVLLDSVHREAKLHPLGYLVIRSRLLGVLENRLRTAYWLHRHPEISESDVNTPIVITGLQRTGTTLLQRLLAADLEVRSLSSWEGLNPAPRAPRDATAGGGGLLGGRGDRTAGGRAPVPDGYSWIASNGDSRVRAAHRAQRALKLLAPEFFIIHPVEYDGPEEEVLLLDSSFISTVPEALMNVPSFSRWLEGQNQSPAYERLVMLLKLLQWQQERPYWVLKSPHHLEWPEYLTSFLPHPRIIMLHRDPVIAASSFYSMVWHSNRLLSAETSAQTLARHWFAKQQRMIRKMMAFRDGRSRPADSGGAVNGAGAGDKAGGGSDAGRSPSASSHEILDVSYYDLVADPIRQVERIYTRFGFAFTEEKRARMEEVLRHHRRDKYGVHRYHPESFGISREELDGAFAEYRDRFDIPREAHE